MALAYLYSKSYRGPAMANKTESKKRAEPSLPTPDSAAGKIGLTCQNCRYYNRTGPYMAPDGKRVPCAQLVKADTAPCARFSVATDTIPLHQDDHAVLARIVAAVPSTQLAALAKMIDGEAQTRKAGLHFAQRFYLRLFGDGSYLNHYVPVTIVSASAETATVQGTQPSGKLFQGDVKRASLIDVAQFAALRRRLVTTGYAQDPKMVSVATASEVVSDARTITPPKPVSQMGTNRTFGRARPVPGFDPKSNILVKGRGSMTQQNDHLADVSRKAGGKVTF